MSTTPQAIVIDFLETPGYCKYQENNTHFRKTDSASESQNFRTLCCLEIKEKTPAEHHEDLRPLGIPHQFLPETT